VSVVGACVGLESSVFESTDFSSFFEVGSVTFGADSVTFGASLGGSVDLRVSVFVCLGVSMGVLDFSSTTGLGLSTNVLGSSGFGLDTSSCFLGASSLGFDSSGLGVSSGF
jgi:hypothetical protein